MAYGDFEGMKNASHETKGNRYVAGAVMGTLALSLALDRGVSALERRNYNKESQLFYNENSGDCSTIAIPGCRTDGQTIGEMLSPRLSEIGDFATVTYPKRGFDVDSIKDNLIEAKRLSGDKPVSLYAMSMGGLVLSKLFADEQFKEAFGTVDTIVFDSSPSGLEDIRKPARIAMELVRNRAVSDSWIMTKIISEAMLYRASKSITHDDFVSDEQVAVHHKTTAMTPLYVVRDQSNFIKSTRVAPGSIEGIAKNIYYVRSEYDNVIDTDHATRAYQEAFNDEVHDIVDESRPHGSHAAGLEYQAKVAELLSLGSPRSFLAAA